MAGSTFRANDSGLQALLRSELIQRKMLEVAEKVTTAAEAAAPVDVAGHPPGEYKASFRTEVVIEPTGRGRYGSVPRAIGKVINDSDHAVFVEFGNGTEKGRGQFVMNNALDVIGEL